MTEYSIEVCLNDSAVKEMLAEGWKVERKELPNGDVQITLSR